MDKTFTAFIYDECGDSKDFAMFDNAEDAIDFARVFGFDEVVNDTTGEIIYTKSVTHFATDPECKCSGHDVQRCNAYKCSFITNEMLSREDVAQVILSFYNCNEGDEVTTDSILSIASELLDVSIDKLLELIER